MCKTHKKSLFLLAALVVMCIAATGSAVADPVIFTGGASYQGGQFGLSVVDKGSNTYAITYTANFANWTGGNLYISGIDFKFGSDLETAGSLVSTTAAGTWTLHDPSGSLTGGAIGTNGCQTNTGATFVCADVTPYNSNATAGSYQWVFNITYANPLTSSDFDYNNDHIGALFVNSSGNSRGILSTGMANNVPEPMSATLLGVGLLGFGFKRFKK